MHLAAQALTQDKTTDDTVKTNASNDDLCSITSSEPDSHTHEQQTQDVVNEPSRSGEGDTKEQRPPEISPQAAGDEKNEHDELTTTTIHSPSEDESSLSISSITDGNAPPQTGNKQIMESSADTLTLVSPLVEDIATNTEGPKEQVSSSISDSSKLLETQDNIDTPAGQSVTVTNSDTIVQKEIKTRDKGDLVVVGSGTSSDRTTPSSTDSHKQGIVLIVI